MLAQSQASAPLGVSVRMLKDRPRSACAHGLLDCQHMIELLRQKIASFTARQKQILLFLVAGSLGALSEIACFYLLHRLGLAILLASTLATSVGILFNYLLSITMVFERGKYRAPIELIMFLAVSALMLVLNQIVFLALMAINHDFPTFAKALAILLIAILSYLAKKRWVFAA
jgi:putative flippase GtrA